MTASIYEVLIADDEPRIRQGLKHIVEWEALGFKIAGEAANGQEALDFLTSKNPAVALLDINMPKLSGLEVIKAAKENGFTGKVIILSGYSDFKFAQEAIKLGVEFYLTKPIDEAELQEILAELSLELTKEQESKAATSHFFARAKETVVRDLMISPEKISVIDLVDLNTAPMDYKVILCEKYIHSPGDNRQLFGSFFENYRQGTLYESLVINGTEAVLLKGGKAIDLFKESVDMAAAHIYSNAGSTFKNIFIACGRTVDTLSEIHLSYKDAKSLLERRFFCEQEQHIITREQLPNFSGKELKLDTPLLEKFTEEFTGYIGSFNRKALAQCLHSLEVLLFGTNCTITEIRYFLTDLYLGVKSSVNRTYVSTAIPFPTNSFVMDFIQSKLYLYEITLFFSEQFEMIMSYIGNYSKDSVLDDVLHYINHNYMHNIKLENIAPLFGYNCSYLGKIFKQKTTVSFNTYLDKIRIENSKRFLEEEVLKVYEIAAKAGFASPDYFYIKFKKYVGISPAEYRKNKQSGE